MNEKLWLKENKNGKDLVECLKDTIKNERWFEINEENSETLLNYIEKLQNNWNELERWLQANDIHYADAIPFRETLRKMQELEGNNE